MVKTILTIALAMIVVGANAEKRDSLRRAKEPTRFALGVHTGIDIGGAVPYPPGKAIGGENKMSAIPHLSAALGLSYTTFFNSRWSAALETTYKTVSLDAKALVSLQGIRDPAKPDSKQFFKGRADIKMSFSMLEIPLYARYTFGDGTNKVILGGYYSRVFKGEFSTIPVQGLVSANPDDPKGWSAFKPGDQNPIKFDDGLDNWDAGIILGYERRIIPRVILSGRFSAGFKDIFRPDSKYLEYSMLHMRGTVVLSYLFLRK